MRKSKCEKSKPLLKHGRYIDLTSSHFDVKKLKGLRWYFSIYVFCVLAASVLLVSLIALIITKFKLFPHLKTTLLIAGMFGCSLLIGSLITIMLSKDFLDPINTLGSAMQKVGEGDFMVKLNENTSVEFVKQLNKDFNNMVHELNNVETLRNDFISNVSHEFKTPLAAIEGYAVLLQNPDLSDELKNEYTERILSSSKRLSALVGNILMLSKLDNETMALTKESYRIDEQIRCSVVALESKWMEKELEFELNMDSIKFKAVESLMNHVFTNLFDNAIKFSPRGGTIYVNLTQSEKELTFTIANAGPAIDDETMKHIFEKFYQGDTSHKSEGNGLGLSLVSKIVTLHHGKISVRNTDDELVEFKIELPIE